MLQEYYFTMMNTEYFGNGDFEFVTSIDERMKYQNMHSVISNCELWQWLRDVNPSEETGFMWCEKSQELTKIITKVHENSIGSSHSGASFFCLLREMEDIAKNGYNT